ANGGCGDSKRTTKSEFHRLIPLQARTIRHIDTVSRWMTFTGWRGSKGSADKEAGVPTIPTPTWSRLSNQLNFSSLFELLGPIERFEPPAILSASADPQSFQ